MQAAPVDSLAAAVEQPALHLIALVLDLARRALEKLEYGTIAVNAWTGGTSTIPVNARASDHQK